MAIPLLAILGASAAAGLLKNELVDKPREERDRKLAAETARLSPWTGMRPDKVRESDAFANALQYGMAGAQLGQGYENFTSDQDLKAAQTEWLKSRSTKNEVPVPQELSYELPARYSPWSIT